MTIYDNSNLAESYSGATTPLTFSFAREVYAGVYPHFLGMMGVSPRTILGNADLFPNMLSFIGNNMYYNLSEWYRMLSLLPGYETNRNFFDRMLGVEKSGGVHLIYRAPASVPTLINFKDRFGLIVQLLKILVSFIFMGLLTKRFTKHFDSILGSARKRLVETKSYDEIVELFIGTEKLLLSLWKTPIANDFAVMVSTGALSVVLEKSGHGDALPELLRSRSRGPLWSLDPSRALVELAMQMSKEEKITLALNLGSAESILEIISNEFPNIKKKLDDYIVVYGARSPHELKLESVTLSERPEMIISLLAQIIEHGKKTEIENVKTKVVHLFRSGLIVRFLSSWSRISIARREETRFRRSLIFGFARTIVLSLGNILHEKKLLDRIDDVFYLQTNELLRPIDEIAKDINLKKIIKDRREAYNYWQTRTLPRRFETENKIEEIERSVRENVEVLKSQPQTLKGTPACFGAGGVLEGKALVLQSFDPNAEFIDRILITKHTDPGWTIIFPLLKAIIVERGGMLSHAAIVARELNIPCIVGVNGAVDEFQTGETVLIEIESGTIKHNENH